MRADALRRTLDVAKGRWGVRHGRSARASGAQVGRSRIPVARSLITGLDPGHSPAASFRLYAHCLRGGQGGVALLAINLDRAASQSLDLLTAAERYSLDAQNPTDKRVRLNGSELRLGARDELPALAGMPAKSEPVIFAPASMTFLAIPDAHNPVCR